MSGKFEDLYKTTIVTCPIIDENPINLKFVAYNGKTYLVLWTLKYRLRSPEKHMSFREMAERFNLVDGESYHTLWRTHIVSEAAAVFILKGLGYSRKETHNLISAFGTAQIRLNLGTRNGEGGGSTPSSPESPEDVLSPQAKEPSPEPISPEADNPFITLDTYEKLVAEIDKGFAKVQSDIRAMKRGLRPEQRSLR